MQYTGGGDVVNLASRLESATKVLGVPVEASAEALQAASHSGTSVSATERRGSIEVRGRSAQGEVVAVHGPDADTPPTSRAG